MTKVEKTAVKSAVKSVENSAVCGTKTRASNKPRVRLLIDVTRTLESGLHSGIQRVVRGLYRGAIKCGPAHGVSVHAVRHSDAHWLDIGPLPPHALETASHYAPSGLPATPYAAAAPVSAPAPLTSCPDDILLLADASWYGHPWPAVDALRRAGGQVVGFVHDLLPLTQRQWFRPGSSQAFEQHLYALLARSTHLFTASEHVLEQVQALAECQTALTCLPPAGVLPAAPDWSLPEIERCSPFFLCVATLEPRKQHGLLLDAIETYWAGGGVANLLLVGAPGWRSNALFARVRNHPQRGHRLHWLQTLSDTGLTALYRKALAMVYLSKDEGFGLPVLEARRAGCPVIASDIPPLREAGGDWPQFVDPGRVDALVDALHKPPTRFSDNRPVTRTWETVAEELFSALSITITPTLSADIV